MKPKGPSKDTVVLGQQASTHRWWKEKRRNYEVFASRLVWQEAGEGNHEAVQRRLKIVRPLRWLQVTSEVQKLAQALIGRKALPRNAADDATHIALDAVYRVEFLLTWNFTHINNPATEEHVRVVCRQQGFHCPVICTPDQLLSI
jgi:hypothetical protein